jgi:eukaryotic-like serine/threonine-protein kinase
MIQGQKIGSYRILTMLGSGGMGEVYRARDLKLGRDVAIKVLPSSFASEPDRVDRLLREARLLATLNHPNIAAIYSLEEFEGVRALVLELVDGPTLADRVAAGPLPLREALLVAGRLAEALLAAHQKGILHRDFKPANIKFTPEGVVKVLDFGLAKLSTRSAADVDLQSATLGAQETKVGVILGTPAYMSPEQVRAKTVDKRTDVWAFGCVLYEMLTGKPAFSGDTVSDMIVAVLTRQPQLDALPKTTPVKIRRLLERCLAKDHDNRMPDLSEARNELEEATTQTLITTTVETPTTSQEAVLGESRHFRIRPWAIVLSTVLVALAIVAWFFKDYVERTVRGEVPTLAVLPLANLSGNPSNDYLGVGVAETLISDLAAVSGITVVSRTAPSNSTGRDLARIAHDLGVSFVVEGAVQQNDGLLKVTARLVRADGSVVWGGSYEGASADLFSIETQLAERLVEAFQLRLTQTERAKLERQQTRDINAFSDYAQGRSLLERLDVAGNLDRAIELFSAAVQKDRNFALAHAGLGEAYWAQYQQTKNQDWTIKARQATLEALRLDPNQSGVRRSLAVIYRGTGDTETAIQELQHALQLQNSDDAHQMLGEILSDKGRIEDAVVEFNKAIALRPNFWGNYDAKGLALYRAGRYAEAAESFERVTQLRPDNANGFQRLGTTYHAAGYTEKALLNYRRALDLAPTPKAYANLGFFYYSQGKFNEAAEAYSEALKLDPTSHITHRNLGDVYQRLNRMTDARAEYTKGIEIADRMLEVNSKDALTLAHRALYEAKLGKRVEALRDANRAVGLTPGDGQVLYIKAVVLALAGEKEAAAKALQDALSHGASASVAREDDDLRSIRETPEFLSITRKKQ